MFTLQQLFLFITSTLVAFSPAATYTEGVVGQPISFNPVKAKTQHEIAVSRLIYRGLFKYDIYGSLIPDLADTWAVSEDGLTYTIKLKSNQTWNDGKPISADDLIYTAFNSPNLTGVATDRVDPLTVRYTLPNKYAPFVSLLTIGVIPNGSLEKDNPIKPTSSGDFSVVRIDKTGSLINEVVLYNPNTHIKRLNFKYYSNDDEILAAAKLGEIDGFLFKDNINLDRFNEYKYPMQGIFYGLFFNMSNDNVKEELFRKQLRNTLNVERMIETRGILVQGPISRSTFTDRALNFNHYDPLLSADLLGKQLVLTVPDIEGHINLAEEIKNIWEDKLNIDVTIRKISPSEIDERVLKPRNFEVLLYGQEVGRDPDRYNTFHSAQAPYPGANISQFNHVRSDRALEEGRNELDDSKRVTHYNELQKVIDEQVPVIFLYHPYDRYYVSKYISGIGDKYTFAPGDRFLDFYNWQRKKIN